MNNTDWRSEHAARLATAVASAVTELTELGNGYTREDFDLVVEAHAQDSDVAESTLADRLVAAGFNRPSESPYAGRRYGVTQ